MTTETLRKEFEAAVIEKYALAKIGPQHFERLADGRYRWDWVARLWEGFQLRTKPSLTEEQVEAIEVSLVYLNDKLAESEAVAEASDDDEEKGLWLTNSAALRKHIAALRSLLPAPAGASGRGE